MKLTFKRFSSIQLSGCMKESLIQAAKTARNLKNKDLTPETRNLKNKDLTPETHPRYRRRGLGKAVVLHALHQMESSGMTHATVANTGTNEASRALYESCSFEPWHVIDDYVKPVPIRHED